MKHLLSLAGALPGCAPLETDARKNKVKKRIAEFGFDFAISDAGKGRSDPGHFPRSPRQRRRTPSRASRVVHPGTDAVVVEPPRVSSARVPPRVVRPAQARPRQKQSPVAGGRTVTQSSSAATSVWTHRGDATWPPTARPARFSRDRRSAVYRHKRLRNAARGMTNEPRDPVAPQWPSRDVNQITGDAGRAAFRKFRIASDIGEPVMGCMEVSEIARREEQEGAKHRRNDPVQGLGPECRAVDGLVQRCEQKDQDNPVNHQA